MKEIYDILREFRKRRGQSLALATLVQVVGSSYRRPGARMLVCEDGSIVGSLSAGCLEKEVALRARDVLQNGDPVLLGFDTRRRFGCAGKIDILVERVSEEFLAELAMNIDARRACRVITTFKGTECGSRVLRSDYDCEQEQKLLQEILPPVRLFIFGDGPDNAPFHALGNLLGWQVTCVVDTNAISIEPDEWTVAIVKSHNYGRDFVSLSKLLPLNLRYVGLIGPRKRRDQLLTELLELGVTINAGFFAPAGLDLGAETPEEIALAIIAEIQCVLRKSSAGSLRERKMPIHPAQEFSRSHLPDECQILAQ
ncbi:MAG: hypothetical protein DME32_07765 [Verrucomicrobia bacterium]|nr:MAG: hypothetical protein DME32_07765 [Verrucomicrobiota bacterium]